jgi:hypothetical protein
MEHNAAQDCTVKRSTVRALGQNSSYFKQYRIVTARYRIVLQREVGFRIFSHPLLEN